MVEFLLFIYFNWVYILIALFVLFIIMGIVIANFSAENYLKTFKKMQKIRTSFGHDASDFSVFLSIKYFQSRIRTSIMNTNEIGSDGSYSPASYTVTLSNEIAFVNSIASIGVVAHEYGHALQHKDNPKILIDNYKFSKVVKFLGFMNFIITALAIYFVATSNFIVSVIFLGILLINFFIALGLKLSTLKLEKNASERALIFLKNLNIFTKKELHLFKKFLNSAKKTYTGDFFRGLLSWTGLTKQTKLF